MSSTKQIWNKNFHKLINLLDKNRSAGKQPLLKLYQTWLGSPRAAATTRSRYSPPVKKAPGCEERGKREKLVTKEENEANRGIAKSPASRLCAPGYNLEIEVD